MAVDQTIGLAGYAKVLRESEERHAERMERLPGRITLLGPGREPPPEEPWKRIELRASGRAAGRALHAVSMPEPAEGTE